MTTIFYSILIRTGIDKVKLIGQLHRHSVLFDWHLNLQNLPMIRKTKEKIKEKKRKESKSWEEGIKVNNG